MGDGSMKVSKCHMNMDAFIHTYKLQKIGDTLRTEGITIDFLLSQSDDQIKQIARELSSKLIQQNKFIYAVYKLKANPATFIAVDVNPPAAYSFDDDDEKQMEEIGKLISKQKLCINDDNNKKSNKKKKKIKINKYKNKC